MLFFRRQARDPTLPELLLDHDLSLENAERYLTQFREMSLYFPFITNAVLSEFSACTKADAVPRSNCLGIIVQ